MLRRSFLQAALACVPFSTVLASAISDQKLTAESLRSLTKEVFDNEPDRKDRGYEGSLNESWGEVLNEVLGYYPNATVRKIKEKFIKVKSKVIILDKAEIYSDKSQTWFYVYIGMARLALKEIRRIEQASEPIK